MREASNGLILTKGDEHLNLFVFFEILSKKQLFSI